MKWLHLGPKRNHQRLHFCDALTLPGAVLHANDTAAGCGLEQSAPCNFAKEALNVFFRPLKRGFAQLFDVFSHEKQVKKGSQANTPQMSRRTYRGTPVVEFANSKIGDDNGFQVKSI